MRDPYLYDDINILVNKANIKDSEKLKEAEGDITKFTLIMVYEQAFNKFNTDTLKEIHKTIFEPLYDFAGEFRTIQISKWEEVLSGDTVRYSYPKDIKKEMDAVSKEIYKLKKSDNKKDLLFKIVRLTAKIWQIHPFREGNTRAVITFSMLLLKRLEIKMDYDLFRQHASYVRNALVWASQGMYSKFEYLENIYFDAAGIEDVNNENGATKTKDYSVVNGYNVSEYKEQPHTYDDEKIH